MPYISTEALVGAGLVILLAFGYQHIAAKPAGTGTGAVPGGAAVAAKKKNKKNKKKGKAGAAGDEAASVSVSEADSDVPKSAPTPQVQTKKGKKGKSGATTPAQATGTPAPAPAPAVVQPETPAPSFADAAAPSAADPAPPKPKTLAEKLVPKPRKTRVDDMLEPEDQAPHLARVMKINSAASPSTPSSEKVAKFADDYDEDSPPVGKPADDGGWNVVASKKKPVSVSIGGGGGGGGSVFGAQAGGVHGSGGDGKQARKNQKKADAKKAAKVAEEEDRLRRLASHKRGLEREKINAIYSQNNNPKVVRQQGKVVSGGQTPALSTDGKLVWD